MKIVCSVQVFYIYQEFGCQRSISHADKDICPSKERTRIMGVMNQEFTGFGQSLRSDIVKLGKCWMRMNNHISILTHETDIHWKGEHGMAHGSYRLNVSFRLP